MSDHIWKDVDLADRFGVDALRDTYERAKAEWKDNRIYKTELSMMFNHKCRYWHEEQNMRLNQLYAELQEEYYD